MSKEEIKKKVLQLELDLEKAIDLAIEETARTKDKEHQKETLDLIEAIKLILKKDCSFAWACEQLGRKRTIFQIKYGLFWNDFYEIKEEIQKETAKAIFQEIEELKENEDEEEFYINMNIEEWNELKKKWLK